MALKVLTHPVSGRTFKMGRRRPTLAPPRFRLRDYLDNTALPTPPATADYTQAALPALQNIYGNDTLGDCVIAGMCHVSGTLTGNAGDLVTYSGDQVVALYSAIGRYVPGDESTDNGCDEQTALAYWLKNGLLPDGSHKIQGSLGVDGTNPTEVRIAAWLFEDLIFGVELPDEWVNPMPEGSGFVWDVAGDADPDNGHCFVGVGYNSGGIVIDTWGMFGVITDQAIQKYATTAGSGELYTVVSLDGIAKATQKAPNGFDWEQLTADFDSMGGTI